MSFDDFVEWLLRIVLLAYVTFATIVLLSGCATVQKPPTEISIPMPVPCVESVPAKPSLHSDAQLKEMQDYPLVITLLAERKLCLEG